jgi:hypothetical protein
MTRLAPTKLIPRDPALVDTRNMATLGFALNSLINFSLSVEIVLPSSPGKRIENTLFILLGSWENGFKGSCRGRFSFRWMVAAE